MGLLIRCITNQNTTNVENGKNSFKSITNDFQKMSHCGTAVDTSMLYTRKMFISISNHMYNRQISHAISLARNVLTCPPQARMLAK